MIFISFQQYMIWTLLIEFGTIKILSSYIFFKISKINIIHLIRNAIFIPLKINFLYTIKKPIPPRMGFFNDLSRSTPNI